MKEAKEDKDHGRVLVLTSDSLGFESRVNHFVFVRPCESTYPHLASFSATWSSSHPTPSPPMVLLWPLGKHTGIWHLAWGLTQSRCFINWVSSLPLPFRRILAIELIYFQPLLCHAFRFTIGTREMVLNCKPEHVSPLLNTLWRITAVHKIQVQMPQLGVQSPSP